MNEKFSDERISAYLDDELAPEARAEVERELADSAELRQAVDELRALGVGLQSLPRYRLETNIAERVLQLAEREVLLGAGMDDKPATIPMGMPPAPLPASVPSRSSPANVAPHSATSAGPFSWRTLAWSASAAAVATLLTNLYHTMDAPLARDASFQVAQGHRDSPDVRPETARSDNGKAKAASGSESDRSRPLPSKEPDAAAMAMSAAVDNSPGAVQDQVAPPPSAVVPDATQSADEAPSVAAKAFQGAAGDAAADKPALESTFAGGRAGPFGGLGGTGDEGEPAASFVYVEVSPEAWQARAFDQVLADNRVMLIDDASDADAAAQDKPGDGALAQAAPREARSGDAATRRAKREPAESDVLVVDLTPEQLDRLLADVERRGGDFAVKTAFDVAPQRFEFAPGAMALGGGNAPAPATVAEGSVANGALADGGLKTQRANTPSAAVPNLGRQALEATDPASIGKGEARLLPGPRDIGSRGGPERKSGRPENALPAAPSAPDAAAPDAAEAPERAAMPEEKSPPPAPRSVAPRSVEGKPDRGSDETAAPRATEPPVADRRSVAATDAPAVAPAEAPKDGEPSVAARLEEDAQAAGGYARRVAPRSDRAQGAPAGRGYGDRSRSARPRPQTDLPAAAAPEAEAQRAPQDKGAADEGRDDAPASPKPRSQALASEAPGTPPLSSPRVRVYFLLRPAERGPSTADLAKPAEANAPAPAPADAAPAAPASPK